MRVVEGKLSSSGLRVAIVAGRFNGFIVEQLVAGAVDALTRSGAEAKDLLIVRCPGSFELPQVVRWVLDAGGVDAVVVLGCVIRGATPHFDYVAAEAARIGALAVESRVPVTFGVLTTDSIEQAIERAGTKAGNKGFDAAMAAVELAQVKRALGERRQG